MKSDKLKSLVGTLFGSINKLTIALVILNALFLGSMLVTSFYQTGGGFPLDDSWIHQTYARGIAETGTWQYSLNAKSAGSTSPLWTVLLVPGHLISLSIPYAWTFLLTWFTFISLLAVSVMLLYRLSRGNLGLTAVFGISLSMEWHLLWAAGSGMETLLIAAGFLWIFYLLRLKKHYPLIGLLTGLLVFIRLEGITILGPVLLLLFVDYRQGKIKNRDIIQFTLFLVIPIIVYALHNFHLSGSVFPNTLAAKSTEYAELKSNPFILRFLSLFSVLLIGPGVILLPGFIFGLWHSWRTQDRWMQAVIVWLLGFIIIYTVQLPVTYQHGRYLIPILPVYMLLGFQGTIVLLSLARGKLLQLGRFFILGSLIVTSLVFSVLGVATYVKDVTIINDLMVSPAKWISLNTLPDAIIASHDIGAIGYFANRRIVDLGGLIDPKVIPILRDEVALQKHMDDTNADYLLILSDWYRELNKAGELVIRFTEKTGLTSVTADILKIP